MCTTTAAPTPTMKLQVDTAAQRIVFAEAGKDVVDFIFGLLAMPLGVVDRLPVKEYGALGSIASVEKMDAAYMQSTTARDALLTNPEPPERRPSSSSPCREIRTPAAASVRFNFSPHQPPAPKISHILREDPNQALPEYLYRCETCRTSLFGQSNSGKGFVQGVATYTVMDDLTVTPTSGVSSVALLKKLGLKDLDPVEERTVNIGHDEVLGIIKAALNSKTVLTDALLAKN